MATGLGPKIQEFGPNLERMSCWSVNLSQAYSSCYLLRVCVLLRHSFSRLCSACCCSVRKRHILVLIATLDFLSTSLASLPPPPSTLVKSK